ncbi:MAG: HD domain-containing protein [Nitrospirae bacterium]|nr:HD domain-containing protein [Nitrospirota bacterium]
MNTAVLDMDARGRVRLWSAGAEALLGLAADQVLGVPLADLLDADRVPGGDAVQAVERYFAASGWPPADVTVDVPVRRGDGGVLEAAMTLSAYTIHSRRRVIAVIREAGEQGDLGAARLREHHIMHATIAAIGRMMAARDPYTAGHQQRMARLARAIALDMGLGEERAEGVFIGAEIHDIGKIDVPAEILVKPTQLHDMEWRLMQRHPSVGYDVLKDIAFPWPVADIAHQHHERLDGSGYPQGLKGNDICLEARIVTVADVVEAMSSHRPYRPALALREAMTELYDHCDTHYDPQVVAACTRLMDGGFRMVDAPEEAMQAHA